MIPRHTITNHLVQNNKQHHRRVLLDWTGFIIQSNKRYHRNVLLDNFDLNCHTLGFHPQTQKAIAITLNSILLSSFHLNDLTLGFYPETQT